MLVNATITVHRMTTAGTGPNIAGITVKSNISSNNWPKTNKSVETKHEPYE